MSEIGVGSAVSSQPASPAARNSSPSNTSVIQTMLHNSKDCLESGGRSLFASRILDGIAAGKRSPSPLSFIRGASFCGKDREGSRLYFGPGFITPASESPGPIYDPQQLLNAEVGKSFSFGRAPRYPIEHRNFASLSEMVVLPGSIGKQVESSMRTAGSASFIRANRLNERQFISRMHIVPEPDVPGPGSYANVEATTNDHRGAMLIGSRNDKVFISKAHVVDRIGAESPGPIYDPRDSLRTKDPFPAITSAMKGAPKFTMAGNPQLSAPHDAVTAAPILDPNSPCRMEKTEDGKVVRKCAHELAHPGGVARHVRQEPFITSEHSKVQPTAETPGPAYYRVNSSTLSTNGVSFPKTAKTRRERVEKSPGLNHSNPGNDAYTRHNARGPVFGSKLPYEDKSNRFKSNVYLGKSFVVEGPDTPGMVYNVPELERGPAYTMHFKEKKIDRRLFPGPSTSRFISKDIARENLGQYSPGPKYDTRRDISKDSPVYEEVPRIACHVGRSELDDDEKKRQERRSSASAARRTKSSEPLILEPKYDFLSTNRGHRIVAIAPRPTETRKGPDDALDDAALAAVMSRTPMFKLVEKSVCSPTMTKSGRSQPTKGLNLPGPGQYTPSFALVENRAASVPLGLL